MPDPPLPPIEWVPGPRTWWVPRLVPALVAVPLYLALIATIALRGVPEYPSAVYWVLLLFPAAFVVVLVAMQARLVARFPSIRAVGIAPWGLTLDFGLLKETYSWEELGAFRQVVATEVTPTGRTTERRGGIRVGRVLAGGSFALSPRQAERLAQFLRIA